MAMDIYFSKTLEWDIQTFRDNTTKIAELLADSSSELGSTQNLSTDQFTEIYELTTITDDLAKSIVDKLTDLSAMEEDQAETFTTKLLRKVTPDQKRLETEFKASFEMFQRIHRQVMERQRVTIASLRNSLAQSAIPSETDEITPVLVNHSVVSEVFGQTTEEEVDGPCPDSFQMMQIDGDGKFLLDIMLEKKKDLQNLEDKAIQLHYIGRKLAEITHEQGDVIDAVEKNVEVTTEVTENAKTALQSAIVLKKKASRKKCLCIILIVVAILVLAIIVAIAIYFKI